MDKNQLNVDLTGKVPVSKDVTFLCLSLALSAAALYFYVRPIYGETLELEKQNTQKTEELRSSKELLVSIKNFKRDNEDSVANSKKLAAFIPSRDNSEDFFVHIKEMAKASNLEITTFSIQDLKAATAGVSAVPAAGATPAAGAAGEPGASSYAETRTFKLNERDATFSVRGDYDNVLSLAKTLENGIPFIQENTMHVEVKKDESVSNLNQAKAAPQGPVIVTAKIDFKFYYY